MEEFAKSKFQANHHRLPLAPASLVALTGPATCTNTTNVNANSTAFAPHSENKGVKILNKKGEKVY